MSNYRLKINSKGNLKEVRRRKMEMLKPKRKYNTKKTGKEELDRYVDLINDENYMKKAIEGIADILTEVIQ